MWQAKRGRICNPKKNQHQFNSRKQICNFRRSADKNVRSCAFTQKSVLSFTLDSSYSGWICLIKRKLFNGKNRLPSHSRWLSSTGRNGSKDLKGERARPTSDLRKSSNTGWKDRLIFHVLLLLDGTSPTGCKLIATHAGEDWSQVCHRESVGRITTTWNKITDHLCRNRHGARRRQRKAGSLGRDDDLHEQGRLFRQIGDTWR